MSPIETDPAALLRALQMINADGNITESAVDHRTMFEAHSRKLARLTMSGLWQLTHDGRKLLAENTGERT